MIVSSQIRINAKALKFESRIFWWWFLIHTKPPRINVMEKTDQKPIDKKESNPLGIMESSIADNHRVESTHAESNLRQSNTRKRDRRKKEYWKLEIIKTINIYIFLSLFIILRHSVSGFVIAPPWANPEVNRCSKKSWQLIYWPQDDKCYQIFEQGPCPRSQVKNCFIDNWNPM